MGERSLVTQGGRGREEEGIEDRSGRLGGGGYLRTLVSSSSSSQILHNCACKEESCTATYLEIRDTSELLTLGTQSQPQKFASVLAASIIETRQQRADRLQREAMDPVTKADLKDLFKELRASGRRTSSLPSRPSLSPGGPRSTRRSQICRRQSAYSRSSTRTTRGRTQGRHQRQINPVCWRRGAIRLRTILRRASLLGPMASALHHLHGRRSTGCWSARRPLRPTVRSNSNYSHPPLSIVYHQPGVQGI